MIFQRGEGINDELKYEGIKREKNGINKRKWRE